MKKSRNQNFIDTIDSCLTNGVKNEVFHLTTEDDFLDGKYITIHGEKLLNFGSCSYLGLEVDERLKNGAIEAVKNHGTQFSSSRLFLQNKLYLEAEELLTGIFERPTLLAPTTSLGHIAAIPVLIQDEDLVIMDHQVHGSVQNAVSMLKPRGIKVEMIRHNDMDQLEALVKAERTRYNKIWYMIDGVYSMYGDYAPIPEIRSLMDKYDQLWTYADDAHGMSWTGKYGRGTVLEHGPLHDHMVLSSSLAKAFSCGGGVLVFPNEEMCRKVRTCGAAFTFSGPVQPPMLGAIIASAKLHYTTEFKRRAERFKNMREKTLQFIRSKDLPLVMPSDSPIFYLATGLPRTGYNMAKKLIEKGYYVDIGIFPGVPVKCTGIRIALNANMNLNDIEGLIMEIIQLYPQVLEEEGQSMENISQYFNINFKDPFSINLPRQEKFITTHYNTIDKIDRDLWDRLLGDKGSFDYEGCRFLEASFSGNDEKENNWRFHYFIINDLMGTPIIATFVTELFIKDDMLAPASVSENIEQLRKDNKYLLTSRVLMMGSLLSEGEHIYIDRTTADWKAAFKLLLQLINREKQSCGAEGVYLRDFDSSDHEITDLLLNEGFIKTDMPDTHMLPNIQQWTYGTLDKKKRKHIRENCLNKRENFIVEEVTNLDIDKQLYGLYANVKKQSLKLNTFNLPEKLFKNFIKSPHWDTIIIKLKNHNNIVAVVFSHISANNYCPMVIGLDYGAIKEYSIYRQAIYQLIIRAQALGKQTLHFGMEAAVEKQKFGAIAHNKSAFVQIDSNFNAAIINQIMVVNN